MDDKRQEHGRARRTFLAGATVVFGSFTLGAGSALADVATEPDADKTRTSLHQEVSFHATAARIYEIFLDSKQFGTMTNLGADISPEPGGVFAMFGGVIVGRNIELIPAQRIVQAWRPKYWDPGVYSMVKFELAADGAQTKIILDHTGFPAGTYKGLYSGWPERYWDPLKKYLA